MTNRARRVSVADDEGLLGGDPYDYADAFEIRLRATDGRTAEQLVRDALERSPSALRSGIWLGHRHVVRLRLGPRTSPAHVLGWTIVASRPEVVHLEAVSPLVRAAIVGRRRDERRLVVTTCLYFKKPVAAAMLWKIVGPLHRRVVPYLLEYTARLPDKALQRVSRG